MPIVNQLIDHDNLDDLEFTSAVFNHWFVINPTKRFQKFDHIPFFSYVTFVQDPQPQAPGEPLKEMKLSISFADPGLIPGFCPQLTQSDFLERLLGRNKEEEYPFAQPDGPDPDMTAWVRHFPSKIPNRMGPEVIWYNSLHDPGIYSVIFIEITTYSY